jgi:6-phosphogluconolactonase
MFLQCSEQYTLLRGRFAVAVPGGFTPARLFQLLAGNPYSVRIAWDPIHFFWTDERCVPVYDHESNFKIANDNLLSRVNIPEANIHRIHGEEGPDSGSMSYEEELKRFFDTPAHPVFDLIILGMGEDGHVASLFPNTPALMEKRRLVVPVYRQGFMHDRISLSLSVINNAENILFLVSGGRKAHALKTVLSAEEDKGNYPAGLICPEHGTITWLADQEAAAEIKHS